MPDTYEDIRKKYLGGDTEKEPPPEQPSSSYEEIRAKYMPEPEEAPPAPPPEPEGDEFGYIRDAQTLEPAEPTGTSPLPLRGGAGPDVSTVPGPTDAPDLLRMDPRVEEVNPFEAFDVLPALLKTVGGQAQRGVGLTEHETLPWDILFQSQAEQAIPSMHREPEGLKEQTAYHLKHMPWQERVLYDPALLASGPRIALTGAQLAKPATKALAEAVGKAAPDLAPTIERLGTGSARAMTAMEKLALGAEAPFHLLNTARRTAKAPAAAGKVIPTVERPADAVSAMKGADPEQIETVARQYTMEGPLSRKPISVADIIARGQETVNAKINVKLRGKPKVIRGLFDRFKQSGSLQQPFDVDDFIHEFGHGLEGKLFGVGGAPDEWAHVADELMAMSEQVFPETYKGAAAQREGFAEFMRRWLVKPDSAQGAMPETFKWFQGEILDANPALAKQVNGLRDTISEYAAQGSLSRAAAMFKPAPDLDPIISKGKRTALRFKEKHWDEAAFIQEMEQDIMRRSGREIPEVDRPAEWYAQTVGTSEATAHHSLVRAQIDFNNKYMGRSAVDIMRTVSEKKQLGELAAYHLARHTEHSINARGIPTGLPIEDAIEIRRLFETNPKYAHIPQAQKDITRYLQNEFILYAREIGAEDVALKFFNDNPHYTPLLRQMGDILTGSGAGGMGMLKGRKGVSAAVPIKAYHEQIRNYSASMRRAALDARVKRLIGNLSEYEGAGSWVEKVPGAKVPPAVKKLREIEDQLLDAGADLTDANMDELISIFSNKQVLPKGEPILPVRVGKKGQIATEYYRLHPEVYRELAEMGPKSVGWFLRGSRAVTNVMKLGMTGIRGSFGIANFAMRDMLTSFIIDPMGKGAGILPLHIYRNMKGLARAGRNALGDLFPTLRKYEATRKLVDDPVMEAYKAAGMDMSELIAQDKNFKKYLQRNVNPNILKDVGNIILHPVDSLRTLLGPFESAARVAQIERLLKESGVAIRKGAPLTDDQALLIRKVSSEVSTNFRRMGTKSRVINMVKVFYNARVQGLRLTAHAFKGKNLPKTLLRGSQLSGLTLGLWSMNKDNPHYQALPAWRRLGFWNIYLGEDDAGNPSFFSIPIPFELGIIFKAAPEAMANAMYNSDKEGAATKELVALAEETAKTALPLDIQMDDWTTAMWSAVKNISATSGIVDVVANRRWPNSPIVPKRLQELPPRSQVAAYTSATARTIGELLGMSPAKADHLMHTYTGGALTDFIAQVESVAGHPLKNEALMEAADHWLVGRFFPRDISNSAAVREMWDEYSRLKALDNDWKQRRRGKSDGWERYQLSGADRGRLTRLETFVKQYKAAGKLYDGSETSAEARRYRRRMVEIAERAMK